MTCINSEKKMFDVSYSRIITDYYTNDNKHRGRVIMTVRH